MDNRLTDGFTWNMAIKADQKVMANRCWLLQCASCTDMKKIVHQNNQLLLKLTQDSSLCETRNERDCKAEYKQCISF